jgi:hypothetical protein
MRWFRRGQAERHDPDPGLPAAVLDDLRRRFGAHDPAPFHVQADALARELDGGDTLAVAAGIVHEFAESAYREVWALAADLSRRTGYQFTFDRLNYRPLYGAAQPDLRWPLFGLPCGLHPYVHVAAAVTVLGNRAKRAVRQSDPQPLLAHVFEILDLTVAGWEFARIRVDTDAAALAHGLIGTARDLRAAMSEEPPLPPPVRDLMRRNNTVDVYDPDAHRIVGGVNPGRAMREALLA